MKEVANTNAQKDVLKEIMENAESGVSISPISDAIFIRGIKKAEAITISNMQK